MPGSPENGGSNPSLTIAGYGLRGAKFVGLIATVPSLVMLASTVVSFSFDVGNGPVELNVRSPSELNDDQWHRISAERNVKEAILLLDQQYKEVRPAPPQGHTRLELYSQLYVAPYPLPPPPAPRGRTKAITLRMIGAAGGQRGFLGCIRSLRMNGVTLDLEERAKVTPGVKPGCSGHCTSYGMYCRNGGKCVEKYNGYSCDCISTAYDGPFCTKVLGEIEIFQRSVSALTCVLADVGGFFEAGTLLKYSFLPEVTGAAAVATAAKDTKGLSQSPPTEANLTREDLSFSFSTSSSPSILLYISSRTQDYLAVVLRHNGTLQIRYNLGGLREPFTINVDQRYMANGQPHSVNISRQERSIQLQGLEVELEVEPWGTGGDQKCDCRWGPMEQEEIRSVAAGGELGNGRRSEVWLQVGTWGTGGDQRCGCRWGPGEREEIRSAAAGGDLANGRRSEVWLQVGTWGTGGDQKCSCRWGPGEREEIRSVDAGGDLGNRRRSEVWLQVGTWGTGGDQKCGCRWGPGEQEEIRDGATVAALGKRKEIRGAAAGGDLGNRRRSETELQRSEVRPQVGTWGTGGDQRRSYSSGPGEREEIRSVAAGGALRNGQ
ncbi:hypothetical protein JZ751_000803 [Albula glossodonta]|uniref:Uncharacterized protein n=1 Tax=Albula glossodonta TaxID=121402 RepID=A0A8T2PX35_9TELE|nr:hypothetical protein JZ751_000803 [Albula glossodonta]